jgi:hypothetical protein
MRKGEKKMILSVQDKKTIGEAQKKIIWALSYDKRDFTGKILDFAEGGGCYEVKFTHRTKFIAKENIRRSWIDDCNPSTKYLPEELKKKFDKIEQKIREERGGPD